MWTKQQEIQKSGLFKATGNPKIQQEKNVLPNIPGKKFVFQLEMSTYSLIIFSKT